MGGVSRINCNLYDALSEDGIECFFLSSTYNAKNEIYGNQLWLPERHILHSVVNIDWLHQLIEEKGVNIIINNIFDKDVIHFLDVARSNTQCKIISWIHNNFVEHYSLIGYRREGLKKRNLFLTSPVIIKLLRHCAKVKYQKIAQNIYQNSDIVLTVHEKNIKEFLFLLGQKDRENKVISIPNFVLPIEREVSIREKSKSVVWCGTIDYAAKKTHWMLQIWKIVQSKHRDWKLIIIGDGKYLDSMKEYAKRLNVEHLSFVGRVKPDRYYRQATILCSTSITESFGLTLVEGMQNRVVPVAFASSPSICDLVAGNGILIYPFDKKKFAEALSDLMSDAARCKMLSERCRQSSLTYEKTHVLGMWKNLIEEVSK